MDKIRDQYDVLVIGGGIHGAGVALVARAAGYTVLLVEKKQWASGTSSKSSKLIHGGLRYLQTGQFRLVYECLSERKWMLDKIPDLVSANCFYIPIYKRSHYSRWKIQLGLWLYHLLSGSSQYSQYKKLPKSQWQSLSGLKQDDLLSVFAYQDAQTDDTLLTQELVKRAQQLGADCFEETELVSMKRVKNTNRACLQLANGELLELACQTVVNATGPWVNDTLNKLGQDSQSLAIDLVQGSHLVISPQLSKECFYLEAPQDQRAVFCLPWKGKSLVGTTELNFKAAPEKAKVTQAEIDYLIDTVKYYFPDYAFEIESQFCGLRVLMTSNKKAFLRSRDTVLHSSQNVISLYGGKLTAWRATAGKVLKAIDQQFGKRSSVDLDDIL